MTAPEHFDAVIIGAGQAGVPLAQALAQAGRTTALIEREHVGGTCINEGCTPTKTMVASARVAYLARSAADYGVHTGPVSVDMAHVRQRKRDMVDSFRSGSEHRIEQMEGLEWIVGEASFTSPTTLSVQLNNGEQRELSAATIFINTGARPAKPRIDGVDTVSILDSTSIMELDSVPDHLIVVGGGYVGLEFAQMFRRFGSRVTIIQRGERLLAREDDDVADAVADILRDDGIDVLLHTSTQRVARAADDTITLTVMGPDGEQTITGSHLLVAAGRTPNTDRLNLQAAGLVADKHGFLAVNERLETRAPHIYALGDVNGGAAFTHVSYDDFRILRTNLIDGGAATTTERLVPYTVFIDPQLGRVGLSESEARAQHRNIRVATMPMSYVARALEVWTSRAAC